MFNTPPPLPLTLLWIAWIAIAIWCAVNVFLAIKRVTRIDRRMHNRIATNEEFTPPAIVVIAIKGLGDHFDEHIHSLLHQDYPAYRLLFAVQSESDLAYPALQKVQADLKDPSQIQVVVAGRAQSGGQKAHNLLEALKHITPQDEAILFADADIIANPLWIHRLVAPLSRQSQAAATGYRWIVPQSLDHANLPTKLASIINASVALLQGPNWRCHAWGGSTAMLQSTLNEINLPDYWKGALSDDYQVTRALHHAKRRLVFIPRILLPTPAHFTFASLLEFGRRQYLITRIHAPLIWTLGLLATSLYLIALATVILSAIGAVPGFQWGLLAWLIVILADFARAYARTKLVANIFDKPTCDLIKPTFLLEYFATPLVMATHLLLILASALGNTITWANITYRLNSPTDIEILDRDD